MNRNGTPTSTRNPNAGMVSPDPAGMTPAERARIVREALAEVRRRAKWLRETSKVMRKADR